MMTGLHTVIQAFIRTFGSWEWCTRHKQITNGAGPTFSHALNKDLETCQNYRQQLTFFPAFFSHLCQNYLSVADLRYEQLASSHWHERQLLTTEEHFSERVGALSQHAAFQLT